MQLFHVCLGRETNHTINTIHVSMFYKLELPLKNDGLFGWKKMPWNRPSTDTSINCKNYFKWRECGTFCTLGIKFLITILTWRSANLYINIAWSKTDYRSKAIPKSHMEKKSIEIYNNQTDLHRSLVGWIGEVNFNWTIYNWLQIVIIKEIV